MLVDALILASFIIFLTMFLPNWGLLDSNYRAEQWDYISYTFGLGVSKALWKSKNTSRGPEINFLLLFGTTI